MDPDRDAFLRAIREAPDDDAPRLVFADWLEEFGGQPERAEFIRAQIHVWRRLDSIPHRDLPDGRRVADGHQVCDHGPDDYLCSWPAAGELESTWCPYHRAYQQQADYFFLRFRDLDPGFPPGSPQLQPVGGDQLLIAAWLWVFRRGFAEFTQCTAADWLAHADAILAEHPVREVRLATEPDIVSRRSARGDDGWHRWHLPGRTHLDYRRDDEPTWRPLCLRLLAAEWPSVKTWHLPPEPIAARPGGASARLDLSGLFR